MVKYLLLLGLITSCLTTKLVIDDYDVIRFNEKYPLRGNNISQDYLIDVPKGGVLEKLKTGDIGTEYRINYPDSAVIYIQNDKWFGSRLNFENRYRMNISIINKKHENDTISYGGTQSNGLVWRENFVGEVVVGYINVKHINVVKFDNSIGSVRKNRK